MKMAENSINQTIPLEKRLNLALEAIQSSTVPSIRTVASLYSVPRTTLQHRLRGRVTRRDAQNNNRKLSSTEEQVLLDRIKLLDDRGFSPTLPFIRRMANLLLTQRAQSSTIGKNWLTRFVKRHEDLMSSYLRKYDYQRARCEDPKQIQAWFNLVQNTVAKYGIATEDIYNFDESGFQMGVIATTKVVTQMGRSKKTGARIKPGRPKVVQPGDRNWVTVIEGINATGWALPSTIIFEGKVHQSPWYRTDIPSDWIIGLSDKGWTNDELGYRWLTEVFDKHTRNRTIGRYRLLLLDGHGSHFTPEFEDFCRNNSIIWLCYPPHSTHLLQALDFGCFSVLKSAYGRLVQEKAELGIFHIDKTDFLTLYHQAHRTTFTEKTIRNAFEAVGIIPFNPEKVLARLKTKTPSPLLQPATLDLSGSSNRLPLKTPRNVMELNAQVEALQRHRTRSGYEETSPTDQALPYLVKACQLAMHGAALLSEENDRLRAENSRQKKKRNARRSYVARGGILTVEEGLQLAEERAEGSRARSGEAGSSEQTRPQRLCGICRQPGHNRLKCPGIQDCIQVIN